MSATTTSPAWKRPGPTTSPTLSPCIVTVSSASTAAPGTSPVEESTPEGMSTATTGASTPFIRSISSAASGAGRTGEAGAEQGVDHEVGAVQFSRLLSVEAGLGEHPDRDAPVAPVRALPAHRTDPARVGEALQDGVRHGPRGPLHQHVDVVSGLGRLHLGRRVERLHAAQAARRRRRSRPPAPASASWTGRSGRRRPALRTPSCARRARHPASGGRESRSRAR